MTSRGGRPPRDRRIKTVRSIIDPDVVLIRRTQGWGGGDLPDDVVQVTGSVLSVCDMSYGTGIVKTSPASNTVSSRAVNGPRSLGGSSEAITIGMTLLVKRGKLLASISLQGWLVGALFTC